MDYVLLDGATPQGCRRVLVASKSGVVASIDSETRDIGEPVVQYEPIRWNLCRDIIETEESVLISEVS